MLHIDRYFLHLQYVVFQQNRLFSVDRCVGHEGLVRCGEPAIRLIARVGWLTLCRR
jgi:hypothetical protein